MIFSSPELSTMEEETFLTDTQVESTQALNPPAMNALRVAGIVIFVSMFVLSTVLVRLARRRKKEREWDDHFKELANGGLVTEEGLNYILDIGRGSQSMHATNNLEEPENPDDDLRNIPLPAFSIKRMSRWPDAKIIYPIPVI